MKKRNLFSTSEFAELSRTTRDRLHHYDRIGLLEPKVRGENKYRYYSIGQISLVNFIRTLLDLGMSLNTIRDVSDRRTPECMKHLLSEQITLIDEKIEQWSKARKLLLTHQRSIDATADVDERAIAVRFLPEEKIILGGLNDYSLGRTDYDALCSFYQAIGAEYPALDLNYPVWALFTKEKIERRVWVWPDRYYFFNPDGHDARPAGLYAVGHMRGGYGNGAELFERMVAHINANGFEICGDAYKEYPLNEICIADEKDYLIRILIAVREKTGTGGAVAAPGAAPPKPARKSRSPLLKP